MLGDFYVKFELPQEPKYRNRKQKVAPSGCQKKITIQIEIGQNQPKISTKPEDHTRHKRC